MCLDVFVHIFKPKMVYPDNKGLCKYCYGPTDPELNTVESNIQQNIFTILEMEDDTTLIKSGYHNTTCRVGHIITEVPWNAHFQFEV